MGVTVARTPHVGSPQVRGWFETAGRVGLVARGVVYCLLGVLAVALATGNRGGEQTDQRGALAELAERGWGKLALVVLTVGFVAYAAWRLVRFFHGEGDDEPDTASRLLDLGKVVIYGALAVSAFRLLRGDEGAASGQEEQQQTFTARLMTDYSWGRWAIGLAGAAVIGAGLWQIWRGLSQKFRKHLDESTGSRHPAVVHLGVVGHVARGAVIIVIGWLLVRAAVRFDPAQPVGVDASLREVAHAPYGPLLLILVGAGLVCFGLYSFAEAKYREVL
jgi:Domain of Unknown Function (DUF1206)